MKTWCNQFLTIILTIILGYMRAQTDLRIRQELDLVSTFLANFLKNNFHLIKWVLHPGMFVFTNFQSDRARISLARFNVFVYKK